MVVKIMVPFWVPNKVRHLIFRVPPKRGHYFDNHPFKRDEHCSVQWFRFSGFQLSGSSVQTRGPIKVNPERDKPGCRV